MKRFIKHMLMAVAAFAVCGAAGAQKSEKAGENREKFAERQARHIAVQLAMDDATTAKFVEAFTQCQKETWEAGAQMRQFRNRKPAELSEEQAGQSLKARFDHSRKVLDIRRKYYDKYSKFLTQKQIQRVYDLEKNMAGRLAKRGKGKKPMQPRQKKN